MATGHDIAMGLRAAYWSMHRQTNAHLAQRGATADQFVLLSLLSEQDGITQQELVRRASSDANTIRAMLLLLEERGLVARGQHPTDGRARRVTLTRKGRQTHDKLLSQIKPLQKRLSAPFRAEEGDTLVVFLSRISEAMVKLERRRGGPRSKASAARAKVRTGRLMKGEKR
jgi:DNA-binding MarR family transcriptional regulator